MYNVCLCDDIPMESDRLSALIRTHLNETHLPHTLVTYDHPDHLLAALKGGASFDIFFLDIVMPALNGLELARHIRQHTPRATIVFVSQSKDYAIEGYQVRALDYLLKPVDALGVARVLDNWSSDLEHSVDIVVRLNARDHTVRLDASHIRYVEALGHYIIFHLMDKPPLKVLSSLENYVPQLTTHPALIRSHKSFVVNLERIETLKRNTFHLDNGEQIPISRLYQTSAKQSYCDFILSR